MAASFVVMLGLASCGLAAAAEGAPPPVLQAFKAPYLPTADTDVLQEVPAATNPRVVEIRDLRQQFDRRPTDLVLANRLASAYVDFGRELGDAHYVGYAEAVIAPLARETGAAGDDAGAAGDGAAVPPSLFSGARPVEACDRHGSAQWPRRG